MSKAMEIYKALENMLGESVKVAHHITKRVAVENGWTYEFFFYEGVLSKIEASNHREFIELWNK